MKKSTENWLRETAQAQLRLPNVLKTTRDWHHFRDLLENPDKVVDTYYVWQALAEGYEIAENPPEQELSAGNIRPVSIKGRTFYAFNLERLLSLVEPRLRFDNQIYVDAHHKVLDLQDLPCFLWAHQNEAPSLWHEGIRWHEGYAIAEAPVHLHTVARITALPLLSASRARVNAWAEAEHIPPCLEKACILLLGIAHDRSPARLRLYADALDSLRELVGTKTGKKAWANAFVQLFTEGVMQDPEAAHAVPFASPLAQAVLDGVEFQPRPKSAP
jgi:hypothetical protein